MKNLEEFYCTVSGGGCGGYFTVPVNVAINGIVEVVCPKCQHKHQRTIKGGQIFEDGRFTKEPTQEILGNIAAWSKTPRSEISRKNRDTNKERNSVTLKTAEKDKARPFLDELWFRVFGGK